MKFTLFPALMLAFAISSNAQEETPNWYVFGGVSFYSENEEAAVGGGIGFRGGIGIQFNPHIGLELVTDFAAELDSTVFYFEGERIDTGGEMVDIDRSRTNYISLMGTLTYPMSERVSFVGKVGLGQYSSELTVEVEEGYFSFPPFSFDDDGQAPVVSLGLMYDLQNRTALEISLVNFFGDASTRSVSGTFRFTF